MYQPELSDELTLAIAGVLYAAAEAAQRNGATARALQLHEQWQEFLEQCKRSREAQAQSEREALQREVTP